MLTDSIVFDFTASSFLELCRDPHGSRVELLEITGVRQRDVDQLIDVLAVALAERFAAQPGYLRIVVWSEAAWLAEHDQTEYDTAREWLDDGLRKLQNPWRVPMVGLVGCAVLDGALPTELEQLCVRERVDLGYERERPPERRSHRRH